MCKNSTLGGYTDWRLPTSDELMVLYTNRDKIGGFKDEIYWSSSIYSTRYPEYHYTVNFYNGNLKDYNSGSYRIRAVRTLTK